MNIEAPAGVLIDLFGTLIDVDVERLPVLQLGERKVRSVYPAICGAILAAHSELSAERIVMELVAVRNKAAAAPQTDEERSSRELFERLLECLLPDGQHADEASHLADLQMRVLAAASYPLPGARAFLEHCRQSDCRVALVSNLDHANSLEWLLAATGLLGCFHALVVSETIRYRKPHRVIFETALAGIGATAQDVVFVGDEPLADIVGASRVGIRGIWINAADVPFPYPDATPMMTIRSLDELRFSPGPRT